MIIISKRNSAGSKVNWHAFTSRDCLLKNWELDQKLDPPRTVVPFLGCPRRKLRTQKIAVISFFGIAFVFFRPNIHCAEGPGITVTKRILNNQDPRTWYKAIHLLMFYIIFIGTIIDSITGTQYKMWDSINVDSFCALFTLSWSLLI